MVDGTRRIAHQGRRSVVPLYEARQNSGACDTIGDSRDTRKGGEHGKEGGEPRISQCPLEEREDDGWEIDSEYLETN